LGRNKRHPDKDVLRDQAVKHPFGKRCVCTAIDCHEIRGRRDCGQPVFLRDVVDPDAGGPDVFHGLGKIRLIFQRGQCAGLADPAHCEVISDLIEGGDKGFCADGVPHPRARHTVSFGKRAHPNNAGCLRGKGRGCACRGEFQIGLIQHKDAALWQGADHFFYGRAVVPGAHRVIRIGDVNQFGPNLGRLLNKGLGVFMIPCVGHGDEFTAKTRDMVVECRVSAGRGDDFVALVHQQPDKVAQKPINTFTDHDVFRGNGVVLCQGIFQVVVFGVPVHPGIFGGILHGGNGHGGGAEYVFVCPQPCAKSAATGAFLCFGPNKRDGGGKRGGKRGKAGFGHAHRKPETRARCKGVVGREAKNTPAKVACFPAPLAPRLIWLHNFQLLLDKELNVFDLNLSSGFFTVASGIRVNITRAGRAMAVTALFLAAATSAPPAVAQAQAKSFFAEGTDTALALGARHIAMGGTGTATSSDAHALYYNPANLALIRRPQVTVTRQLNARLRPLSFAGFVMPLPQMGDLGVDATVALGTYPRVHARSTGAFSETDPESIFLRYLLPGISGTYDGEIDSKTLVRRIALGLAPQAIEGLSFGVNIDWVDCRTNTCGVHAGAAGYEQRSVHATALSFGVGVNYRLGERLTLAAAVSDIKTVLDVTSISTDNNGPREVHFQVDLPRRWNLEASYQVNDRLLLAGGYQSYQGRYGNYDLTLTTVHAGAELRHGAHLISRFGIWAPLEVSASGSSNMVFPAPFAPTFGLGWEAGDFSADLAIYAHPIMSYHQGRAVPSAELSLTYRF